VGASSYGKGLDLAVGKPFKVGITRDQGYISTTVGGALLANQSVVAGGAGTGNLTLRLMLSHYFVAAVDNFSLDRPIKAQKAKAATL
jgi:hypothetical protein